MNNVINIINIIIIAYDFQCSGGVPGTCNTSKMMTKTIISLYFNVPEVFLVPSTPEGR